MESRTCNAASQVLVPFTHKDLESMNCRFPNHFSERNAWRHGCSLVFKMPGVEIQIDQQYSVSVSNIKHKHFKKKMQSNVDSHREGHCQSSKALISLSSYTSLSSGKTVSSSDQRSQTSQNSHSGSTTRAESRVSRLNFPHCVSVCTVDMVSLFLSCGLLRGYRSYMHTGW